eukprot:954481-Prymnesium_polylepis.1
MTPWFACRSDSTDARGGLSAHHGFSATGHLSPQYEHGHLGSDFGGGRCAPFARRSPRASLSRDARPRALFIIV